MMETLPWTEEDIREIKDFFEITPEDEGRMKEMGQVFQKMVDPFLEQLYVYILSFPHTRAYFSDRETIERLRPGIRASFLSHWSGRYDRAFFEQRWRIGQTHDRIGLLPRWGVGAYCLYIRYLVEKFPQVFPERDLKRAAPYLGALAKITLLAIAVNWEAYYQAREARLLQQQEEVKRHHRELQALHTFALKELERLQGEKEALTAELARLKQARNHA